MGLNFYKTMQGNSVQFIEPRQVYKKTLPKYSKYLYSRVPNKTDGNLILFESCSFHLINKKKSSTISLYLPNNFQQFPTFKFIRNSRLSK